VVGLLYLENGTMAGAFADELVEVVQVLATQAVISLENSTLLEALQRLTGALEERVAERTRQLADEIAARDKAETALRQAQKMEAVGQLTGGVAHDFNNLLTVIAGNLDFLENRAGSDGAIRRVVDAAQRAVSRGARLTQQLLAFARRQVLRPEILDLGAAVAECEGLARRAVGEAIEVAIVADPDPCPCRIDPAQFDNAILNLAVNARDAMPKGGRLTISVRNVELDDGNDLDAEPGPYILVSVADTGQGIAPELLDRVFEPFFTTKEIGKGTGLGLSQVYGFVRQSDGHVRIESEVGVGTTVMIYLPKAPGAMVEPEELEGRDAAPTPGSETILVVEDNPDVLEVTAATLEALGYRVLSARTGPEALAVLERGEAIDLLFTDVVMPQGISGDELAERARQMRPGLKVLLTSGYAGAMAVADLPMLGKPYRQVELANKIRAVLGDKA
jgi:signal transduction histidine kinase